MNPLEMMVPEAPASVPPQDPPPPDGAAVTGAAVVAGAGAVPDAEQIGTEKSMPSPQCPVPLSIFPKPPSPQPVPQLFFSFQNLTPFSSP